MNAETYLHVLQDDDQAWLVNVFRAKRPSCGPLADRARAFVLSCPSCWIGDVGGYAPLEESNLMLFDAIFDKVHGAYQSVPGQLDAHVKTQFDQETYAKRLQKYERDVAAGRTRYVKPTAPPIPRWLRAPTFLEAVREEIGANFVTITKAKTRVLLDAYAQAGGAVTLAALEAFLVENIGKRIFIVEWKAP